MNDMFFGLGALFWLFFLIIAVFIAILSLLMPWFVYQIRLEVREIKENLVDLKRLVAALPIQPPPARPVPQEYASGSAEEPGQAENTAGDADIARKPSTGDAPSEDDEDDLRYAPPELRKQKP